MAWMNRKKKKGYVFYWLVLEKTDMVTNSSKSEYYFNKSEDTEPDIFIDRDNDNELDKNFWSETGKDLFDEAKPELMRTVEYTPSEDEEQVKTEWQYYYSFYYETVTEKELVPVVCAECEYYVNPIGLDLKGPQICDFRNGEYYYCPGYADARKCRGCTLAKITRRCSLHVEMNTVTGEIAYGDCLQWNRNGECGDWKERFDDEG